MLKASAIVASAFFAALSLTASAQTGPGTSSKSQPSAAKQCDGLTGAALEKCRREAAPGRSDASTSRSGGTSPGSSGDAASRTGTAPGYGGSTEKGKK
jgi:hypothetical protein